MQPPAALPVPQKHYKAIKRLVGIRLFSTEIKIFLNYLKHIAFFIIL